MNYGKFILGLYLSFALGMGYLVYRSVNQKFDLVTPDYYAQELQFQKRLDATNRSNALSEKISYQIENENITFSLPQEMQAKNLKGNLKIYCPWDASKDKNVSFDTQSSDHLSLPKPELPKGNYKLMLNWEMDGQQYYWER